MNSQSQAKSPERLRAMVAGTLANFQHPTLKHNLTTLKALHHVAWMDDPLHVELVMPFVWHSAFEELKEQCSAELLRITGAKAIDWKLSHNIATLKRVKNQPGINGVKNIIAVTSGKGGVGKSTITTLFASYLHANAKDKGLVIGVVDIDDFQNSIGSLRDRDKRDPDYSEEFDVIPLSSEEFINRIDFLRDAFDIILVDFPGSLKQSGVVKSLMLIDIIIIPFEPSKLDLIHTLQFYKFYEENILKYRNGHNMKTLVRGLPNRVVPNILEYKDLIEKKDKLPFKLLDNHIKDLRVSFQRNLSTISNNYDNACDDFGEEVLKLIIEFVKS